ncbi:hypothetical protein [Shewanella sp. TC10]|uniref:hypothetical protein n=1 Tax=Shewanella sp. TC10 TaxID=1419739 RepID=UPI00129E8BE3|nr:hypothetical protein [Shewanella sp. TC10]
MQSQASFKDRKVGEIIAANYCNEWLTLKLRQTHNSDTDSNGFAVSNTAKHGVK